jgi:hypothetical protein
MDFGPRPGRDIAACHCTPPSRVASLSGPAGGTRPGLRPKVCVKGAGPPGQHVPAGGSSPRRCAGREVACSSPSSEMLPAALHFLCLGPQAPASCQAGPLRPATHPPGQISLFGQGSVAPARMAPTRGTRHSPKGRPAGEGLAGPLGAAVAENCDLRRGERLNRSENAAEPMPRSSPLPPRPPRRSGGGCPRRLSRRFP